MTAPQHPALEQLSMFGVDEPRRRRQRFIAPDELTWADVELPDDPETLLFREKLRKSWGEL